MNKIPRPPRAPRTGVSVALQLPAVSDVPEVHAVVCALQDNERTMALSTLDRLTRSHSHRRRHGSHGARPVRHFCQLNEEQRTADAMKMVLAADSLRAEAQERALRRYKKKLAMERILDYKNRNMPVQPADLDILYEVLSKLQGFEKFSEVALRRICMVLKVEHHDARTVVFEQGAKPTCWYVILRGSVDVLVRRNLAAQNSAFDAMMGAQKEMKAVGRKRSSSMGGSDDPLMNSIGKPNDGQGSGGPQYLRRRRNSVDVTHLLSAEEAPAPSREIQTPPLASPQSSPTTKRRVSVNSLAVSMAEEESPVEQKTFESEQEEALARNLSTLGLETGADVLEAVKRGVDNTAPGSHATVVASTVRELHAAKQRRMSVGTSGTGRSDSAQSNASVVVRPIEGHAESSQGSHSHGHSQQGSQHGGEHSSPLAIRGRRRAHSDSSQGRSIDSGNANMPSPLDEHQFPRHEHLAEIMEESMEASRAALSLTKTPVAPSSPRRSSLSVLHGPNRNILNLDGTGFIRAGGTKHIVNNLEAKSLPEDPPPPVVTIGDASPALSSPKNHSDSPIESPPQRPRQLQMHASPPTGRRGSGVEESMDGRMSRDGRRSSFSMRGKQVDVNDPYHNQLVVAELTAGQPFGELGLVRKELRSATIVCKTRSILLRVDADDYEHIAKFQVQSELKDKLKFLEQFEVFQDLLGTRELNNLAEKMTYREYKPGEIVYSEGDKVEKMFFIKAGGVKLLKRIESTGPPTLNASIPATTNGTVHLTLCELARGATFGGHMAVPTMENTVRAGRLGATAGILPWYDIQQIEHPSISRRQDLSPVVRFSSEQLVTMKEQKRHERQWTQYRATVLSEVVHDHEVDRDRERSFFQHKVLPASPRKFKF